MDIKPLNGRIIIEGQEERPEEITQGGLVVPGKAMPRQCIGKVLAVAEDCKSNINVDDTICFNPSGLRRETISAENVFYHLAEGDVIAILNKKEN